MQIYFKIYLIFAIQTFVIDCSIKNNKDKLDSINMISFLNQTEGNSELNNVVINK